MLSGRDGVSGSGSLQYSHGYHALLRELGNGKETRILESTAMLTESM